MSWKTTPRDGNNRTQKETSTDVHRVRTGALRACVLTCVRVLVSDSRRQRTASENFDVSRVETITSPRESAFGFILSSGFNARENIRQHSTGSM